MAIADFPFSFASQPIIDPTTGQPALNATGGVLQDPKTGNLLGMADMNGNPVSSITGNAFGMSQPFRSTQLAVLVKFGNVYVQAPAIEIFDALQIASDAVLLSQQAAASAQAAQTAVQQIISNGGGGGGGVTDHGALSGLGDDDHLQYHNDARGDLRYYVKAQADANTAGAVAAASTNDRNRTNHYGSQPASTISDFSSAVQAIAGSTPADVQQQLNNKADLNDGKVPRSQLPTVFISRTYDQGPPTPAECAALGYLEGYYFLVDPAPTS